MHAEPASGYRLIAELLLDPEERDRAVVDREVRRLDAPAPRAAERVRSFVAAPAAWSPDEYVQTLELSPPCPLYLGSYLFEEPRTCRGAGMSGRNGYLIALTNLYRHFGLELREKELPDYLPIMLEFASQSLEREAREGPALRRYFLEEYLRPGLTALREALTRNESVYTLLVEAIEDLVRLDLEALAGVPAWAPPVSESPAASPAASPVGSRPL